jgi:hypothetical protein
MNSTIGIYEDHDKALDAVKNLKDAGFPVKQISVIGKTETEVMDNEMHVVMPKDPINVKGIGVGTALGATLGVLTGVGLFAIPGVGFLFGAGALVGAIAGVDFGLIGGGIASVLTTIGVHDDNIKKYHTELEAGKYLVVAHGNKDEVKQASDLLNSHGMHIGIESH